MPKSSEPPESEVTAEELAQKKAPGSAEPPRQHEVSSPEFRARRGTLPS